jgi:hypothetical protein
MAFNAAIPKVTKVSQTNPTNFVSLPQKSEDNYIEKPYLIGRKRFGTRLIQNHKIQKLKLPVY